MNDDVQFSSREKLPETHKNTFVANEKYNSNCSL